MYDEESKAGDATVCVLLVRKANLGLFMPGNIGPGGFVTISNNGIPVNHKYRHHAHNIICTEQAGNLAPGSD
jgi:hypothetical protein